MGGVGPHHRASPPSSHHVIPASTQHATGKRECQRRGRAAGVMLRGQTLTFAKIETIIITLLFTLLCYCHCIDINIVTLLLLQ